MTTRLYYTDSMCREFVATITRSFEHDGKPAVTLDRTAFYPTSGGQPFDTGTIGTARVVDVIDIDDRITHVLDSSLTQGTVVSGAVDWVRRFDHMQQHTGQHILSAAFDATSGNPTISFHMGADASTIDLARDASTSDVERAEAEANRVVWSDEDVVVRFVSAAEAARLPLRKESARQGTLRLIEIPGFDLSACGGTHVRRTGMVGMITVLGVERFKGGSRISFACGGRSLASHRLLRSAMADSIRALSVHPNELAGAIERMQVEAKESRKTLRALRDSLATYEAMAFLESAPLTNSVRVIVRSLAGYDAAGLKSMAAAIVKEPGVAVALFNTGEPLQVVIARSADVELDASQILGQLVGEYGGRGGGKPDLAQGGGLSGDSRQIEWAAAGLLEQVVSRG